jgi:site-specific recombinase XerD
VDANEMHLAAYERALRARNRSERTIQNYAEAIGQLATFHGGTDVTDLDQAGIEAYIEHVVNSPRRNKAGGHHQGSTAAVRFRTLRAFFNWCVSEEILDASPMRRMKEPSTTDAPVPVVDDDNLRLLLRACAGKDFFDRRDTAIIRLWCEPGSPRVAEMAGLGLDDVDLRRSLVTLHGKGDKIRVIPYGAKTGQAIDRYLRLRVKHPKAHQTNAMWIGPKGATTASGLDQMLERRCEQAGIDPIHPHQMRHTSAHNWIDAGGSEGDAMALFGWASAEMPRHYGKSARVERAQRASKRLSPADRL